ncbi:NAD(P) transhydrogenase subunit alpha [Constrictibacter sp. MBR-5]|jgi:NAD(P) transhydrogenase subunit alpha|uniref:NAD(P) transhydrogenase subunit alpha n=1 Tax=Constrictibacter sp. MBR-5 TaxID=3156467 RepID=UPI003393EB0E
MATDTIAQDAATFARKMGRLAVEAEQLAGQAFDIANRTSQTAVHSTGADPLLFGLTVFALAAFVGYYVVLKVTPALHAPLMSVTNAISGIVIVGAMVAAAPALFGASKIMGFIAVVLASINIFGGYIITQRMLQKFRKR